MGHPGRDVAHDGALGVGHHGEGAAVAAADAGDAAGRAVGVGRVGLGGVAVVVDVAEGDEPRGVEGVEGGGGRERGAALAVRHHDRQRRARHVGEEDRTRRALVLDAHHGEPALELRARVLDERRPALRARDQLLEPGQQLAAVADAEREGVRPLEEVLERPPRAIVHKDGLSPSVSSAKNVTITKSINNQLLPWQGTEGNVAELLKLLTHTKSHHKQLFHGILPTKVHRGSQTYARRQRRNPLRGTRMPSRHIRSRPALAIWQLK